jgi:YVTN family beta-propeller protein
MRVSRRGLLLGPAAWLACGRRKATGFQGYCFVANHDGRSVAVVDLSNFRLRKHIGLDAAPNAVLAAPERNPTSPKALVLASDAGTVYEIDATLLAVSRRARAGNTAAGMRVGPRGDALWILYRDPAELVELPLDTFRPSRRIRLGAPPDDFDLSRDGLAAVASQQGGSITLVSLSRAAVERTISTSSIGEPAPSMVRFRSDGLQLIAGNAPERSLSIFDVATGKTVVRLPLPLAPRYFCVNSDGGQIFITGEGADAVAILFPYNTEIWQTVLAGRAPGAMAATNTQPAYLLVANPETNTITVLDQATLKLAALVEVGQHPADILITPDNQYALVLNEKSGDMAVIRLYSLDAARSERVRRYKSAPLFTLIAVGERPVSAAVVNWA